MVEEGYNASMINSNPAPADHPIHDLIKNRWSPRAFAEKTVESEKIDSLLEAARWAPSSFNEQPWRYVVGIKGDETHAKLTECLVEGNAWAKAAPVLMLSVAKKLFDRNQKPNRHYLHDTGAASTIMALQATELGLFIHQMAGYDLDKARELFHIDETYEPAAMIAIGYPPENLQPADRTRNPIEDIRWKA